MSEDLYQILGVDPSASQEEIRKRYLFLVQAYHPDRFPEGETRSNAEAELKKINGAYAVLGDPEKRKEYDQIHSHQASSTKEENSKTEFEIKYEKFKVFFDNAMSNWGKLVESSEESFIEQHKSLIRNLVSQFVYSTNLHTATLYTRREELKEKFFEVLSIFVRTSIAFGIEGAATGLPPGLTQADLSQFSLLFAQVKLSSIFEGQNSAYTVVVRV